MECEVERVYERVPGAPTSTSPTPRLLQALDEEGSAREVWLLPCLPNVAHLPSPIARFLLQ